MITLNNTQYCTLDFSFNSLSSLEGELGSKENRKYFLTLNVGNQTTQEETNEQTL